MKFTPSASFVAIALSLPATALAQSAPPPPPMSDSSLLGPSEGDSALRRQRDTQRLWTLIGVDVGSSLAFTFAFAAPVLVSPQSFSTESQIALIATGIGLSVLVPPLIVTLVGDRMGGRGNAQWAIIGKLLGLMVPIGGFAAGALGYEFAHRNAILEGRF